MKRFLFSIPILVIVIVLVTFLQDNTYSKYKKGITVNVNDTTGGLICDATLDNPGTYVSDDGWAYFIVTAKNYDTNDVVSDVPIEFNLDITNADGSSALYRYSTGEDVGTFASSVTTNNYEFAAKTKQSRNFMVEVKTDGSSAEDVDFKVDLNCSQIPTTPPSKTFTGSLNPASNISTVNTTLGTMDYTGKLVGTINLNGTARESFAGGISVTVKRGNETVCSYTSTLINDSTYQHYIIDNIDCNVNKNDELVLALYNGIGPGNPDTISGTYELINVRE